MTTQQGAAPSTPEPTSEPFTCTCDRCIEACLGKPGWFLPEEIEPLAKALDLTVLQLFQRHLVVDSWLPDDDIPHKILVLSPATERSGVGREWQGSAWGRCRFLTPAYRCFIHSLGKPFECSQLTHTSEASHLDVAKAWDNPQSQTLIHSLLESTS